MLLVNTLDFSAFQLSHTLGFILSMELCINGTVEHED